MSVDTSDFKNGMHIYLEGEVYTIVEFQHVKPGKGGAFVRTKLRKLKTGAALEKTFRAGERFEPAYLERKSLQFLYRQGDDLVLMDLDSFEQVPVSAQAFGEALKYLIEEMEVTCLEVDGQVMGYEIPTFVELEVVETDPGYKGDTVSGSSSKPAKLASGAMIQVPYHISEGDVVKVDTRTDTYLERVKR